jgi:hypothetical protein
MNGVALLVALSALGVDHTWRSTPDSQVEYVLQVEPVFLQALADGQEIKSELPPIIQRVDRICIRIGSGGLKKLDRIAPDWPDLNQPAERQATQREAPGVPLAIYVKAGDQAYQSYELTHGWRPAGNDESQYLVQLDPELVRSLGEGDELYAAILPEAGAVRSFVITAGREALPRQSARPPVTVAQLQTRTGGGPSADPTLTDLTQPEADSVYGGGVPAAESPERAPAPLRSGMQPGWNVSDAGEPDNRAGRYSPTGQPPATPLHPPNTSILDVPQFDEEQFPQRRSVGGNTGAGPTATQGGTPAAKTRAPRYTSQPQSPPSRPVDRGEDRRTAAENNWQSEEPEARVATRTTAVPGTTGDDLPRRSTSPSGDTASQEKKPEFPVLPFTLSLFALFLSLGGNLYLAWTAAEFYSRYKLAVERLRSAAR